MPVVAVAQAEGCDGLACKDEHTRMAFAGRNIYWPTMHQGDPTPPTTLELDPEDDDKTAPLCEGAGTTACTSRKQ